MLSELARICYENSVDKGFWDHRAIKFTDIDGKATPVPNPSIWAEKIALIHTEVSEMLEALRVDDDGDEHLAEECADAVIRILDFTHARGIDIDGAITAKMSKNHLRPRKHGKKF